MKLLLRIKSDSLHKANAEIYQPTSAMRVTPAAAPGQYDPARGQVSYENIPGAATGRMPKLLDSPYGERMRFHRAIHNVLLPGGEDEIAKAYGLHTQDHVIVPGSYEGETNPSTQVVVKMPTDVFGKILPSYKEKLESYAATLGHLLKQESVGYHNPHVVHDLKDANALEFSVGRTLGAPESASLSDALASHLGGDGYALINTPKGARILNFSGMPNPEFHKAVQQAVDDQFENDPVSPRFSAYGAESDLIGNDWKEHPYGEEYRDRIEAAGGSDIFRRVHHIYAPQIASVYREYGKKYGGKAYEEAGEVEGRREKEQQKEGLTLDHYSPSFRPVIRPDFQGTAQAGEERNRPDRIPRAYYYEHGEEPEPRFRGMQRHTVHVGDARVYDLFRDPDGFIRDLRAEGLRGSDLTDALERRVAAAGYDGYRNSDDNKKVVAMFRPIEVQPDGKGLIKSLGGKLYVGRKVKTRTDPGAGSDGGKTHGRAYLRLASRGRGGVFAGVCKAAGTDAQAVAGSPRALGGEGVAPAAPPVSTSSSPTGFHPDNPYLYAEYRPKARALFVNKAASDYLHDMAGLPASYAGVNLRSEGAKSAASFARYDADEANSDADPKRLDSMRRFADEIDRAVEHSKGSNVSIIPTHVHITGNVMATVRHEYIHHRQRIISGGGTSQDSAMALRSEDALRNNEHWWEAVRGLQAKGYHSSAIIATEIPAWVAAGEHRKIGLNDEQARSLMHDYVKHIVELHGPDAAHEMFKHSRKIARDVMREYVPKKILLKAWKPVPGQEAMYFPKSKTPVSDPANTPGFHDEYRAPYSEYRPKSRTIYTNYPGWSVIQRHTRDYASSGINFPMEEALRLRGAVLTTKDHALWSDDDSKKRWTQGIRQLHSVMGQSMEHNPSGGISIVPAGKMYDKYHDVDFPFRLGVVRHELIHNRQAPVEPDMWTTPIDPSLMWKNPHWSAAVEGLNSRGYWAADPVTAHAEIPAWIGAGQHAHLGLNDEQAHSIMRDYVGHLIDAHGPDKAIDMFKHGRSIARRAVAEAIRDRQTPEGEMSKSVLFRFASGKSLLLCKAVPVARYGVEGGDKDYHWTDVHDVFPLDPAAYRQHIEPKLPAGYAPTLDDYRQLHPTHTHYTVVRPGRSGKTVFGRTGSEESLRPARSTALRLPQQGSPMHNTPSFEGWPEGVAAEPENIKGALAHHFGLSSDKAEMVSALLDARASAWGALHNRPPEDWYQTRIGGITSGLTKDERAYYAAREGHTLGDHLTSGSGLPLAMWDSKDYQELGDRHGVPDMGPEHKPEYVMGEDGKPVRDKEGMPVAIPGGLTGNFSYWDKLWLKSNGYDPAQWPESLHAEVQKKLSRSAEPLPHDNLETFNRLMFGLLSPNAPLTDNEFAYSRLRTRDEEGVRHLASYADLLPPHPTPEDRKWVDAMMRNDFRLGTDKGDEAHVSAGFSQDLSNLAELAKLHLQKPDWFNKRPNEDWDQLAERIGTQVRGLGSKTAIFGSVWQNTSKADVQANDRHIARDYVARGTTPMAVGYRNTLLTTWNAAHPDRPFENMSQMLSDEKGNEFATSFMEQKLKADKKTYRLSGMAQEKQHPVFGNIHPDLLAKDEGGNYKYPHLLPRHETENPDGIDWIQEPETADLFSPTYRDVMSFYKQKAAEHGLDPFSYQWMVWDRRRHRLEPHEVIHPGLYKLPKPSITQSVQAANLHKDLGYFNSSKTKQTQELKPTQPLRSLDDQSLPPEYNQSRQSPASLGYLQEGSGQVVPKGAVSWLQDGRAIIRALHAPDVSTAVHEIGHVFRRDLAHSDMETAEKWAGVEGGEWQAQGGGKRHYRSGVWTQGAEEKFARGFERYLHDGEAPNKGLQGVFQKFAGWLGNIYKKVTGLTSFGNPIDPLKGHPINIDISPQMRSVFHRLLDPTAKSVYGDRHVPSCLLILRKSTDIPPPEIDSYRSQSQATEQERADMMQAIKHVGELSYPERLYKPGRMMNSHYILPDGSMVQGATHDIIARDAINHKDIAYGHGPASEYDWGNKDYDEGHFKDKWREMGLEVPYGAGQYAHIHLARKYNFIPVNASRGGVEAYLWHPANGAQLNTIKEISEFNADKPFQYSLRGREIPNSGVYTEEDTPQVQGTVYGHSYNSFPSDHAKFASGIQKAAGGHRMILLKASRPKRPTEADNYAYDHPVTDKEQDDFHAAMKATAPTVYPESLPKRNFNSYFVLRDGTMVGGNDTHNNIARNALRHKDTQYGQDTGAFDTQWPGKPDSYNALLHVGSRYGAFPVMTDPENVEMHLLQPATGAQMETIKEIGKFNPQRKLLYTMGSGTQERTHGYSYDTFPKDHAAFAAGLKKAGFLLVFKAIAYNRQTGQSRGIASYDETHSNPFQRMIANTSKQAQVAVDKVMEPYKPKEVKPPKAAAVVSGIAADHGLTAQGWNEGRSLIPSVHNETGQVSLRAAGDPYVEHHYSGDPAKFEAFRQRLHGTGTTYPSADKKGFTYRDSAGMTHRVRLVSAPSAKPDPVTFRSDEDYARQEKLRNLYQRNPSSRPQSRAQQTPHPQEAPAPPATPPPSQSPVVTPAPPPVPAQAPASTPAAVQAQQNEETKSKGTMEDALREVINASDRNAVRYILKDYAHLPKEQQDDIMAAWKSLWGIKKGDLIFLHKAAEAEHPWITAATKAQKAAETEKATGHLILISKATEPPRKYASTQVELPEAESRAVCALGKKLIPKDILAADGYEDNPHITVKFGLHTDKPEEIGNLLKGEGAIRVKLGKVSVFPSKEGSDFDVVKVDVDSPDLHRLNKKIAALPHTDTHPQYQPHVTLAYVRAGEGHKFIGDDSLDGREITLHHVTFSGKDRMTRQFPLTGKRVLKIGVKRADNHLTAAGK